MAKPRYLWRKLNAIEQETVLAKRKEFGRPWHTPPHRPNYGRSRFHITAGCFEHHPIIGHSPERLDSFARDLLTICQPLADRIFAWCVLPNHYHMLVEVPDVLALLTALGRLHGRTSYYWNGEEQCRGRQVFHNSVERAMKSERHYFATLNYIHHNPVHHKYTQRWQDWPWSSATQYLEQMGRDEAQRIWEEYPVLDYGAGWDAPDF